MLGAAFFTAFVGMFDTENDRIGFAESTRALPGSSLKCVGKTCKGTGPPSPDDDGSVPGEKSSSSAGVVLLIIALVVVTILVVLGVLWYRNRSSRNNETSPVH